MKSIAILGASTHRDKYGNKAVRAYHQKGYTVYPINPGAAEVEGLKAYARIEDLPEAPELVSVYLPPEKLLPLLPAIAAKGCQQLWLNPGSESEAVLAEAERLGLRYTVACSIVAVGLSPGQL